MCTEPITFDRFGVIRDYLYERDENGEYFLGISKDNKLEVYLLTSPEDLYEYLAEESDGFCLIAKRHPDQQRSGVQKSLPLSRKISSSSNGMLEKTRRIVICGGDQFRHVLP